MCKDSNCWVNEGGQKAKLGGETNNPFLLTIGSTLKVHRDFFYPGITTSPAVYLA